MEEFEHEPLTTKVYYYKDNEQTPYVTEVPVPPSKITLYNFKDVLSHKHFKFYQKVKDPTTEMEVKEEILDEDAPMKMSENGRFELYLLTQAEHGTLPRSKENRASFSQFANRMDKRVLSQRNSRHILANPAIYNRYPEAYEDSSMDDTNFYPDSALKTTFATEDDSQVTDSDFTSVSQQQLKKHYRHRKSRRRPLKNMTFMTDSTMTDVSMSLDLITVSFNLNTSISLGLWIRSETNGRGEDVGVYVSKIEPNTLLALDGRIRPGYMIVEVNDISLDAYTNEEAVDILKRETKRSSVLKLTVAQYEKEGPSTLRLPNEPVRPIDTRMWVMHTNMIQQQQQMRNDLIPIPEGIEHASPAVRGTWPSSGIGSSVASSALPDSGFVPNCRFNLKTDSKTVVMAMADPMNGIKSKVLMSDSAAAFRGEDMLEWLRTNVDGLNHEGRCEEYASRLLREGLIIQKIDTNSFTRECFYVFGHGIQNQQHCPHIHRGALKVIQNPQCEVSLTSPGHRCKKSCTLKKMFCIHPNPNRDQENRNRYHHYSSSNMGSTHIP